MIKASAEAVSQGDQRQREQLASRLRDISIDIKRQEGNQWEVTKDNIVEKLKKQKRIDLASSTLTLREPIKEQYGSFIIPVTLEGGVTSELKVNVVKR